MKTPMKKSISLRLCSILAACFLSVISFSAQAEGRKNFNVCWTIYAGWVPWGYIDASGIMDKWAKKYGIQVKITQINDTVEAINQYTANKYDGCVMTNMDALIIPAVSGVDTTALILGSFSNGGDGVVIKGNKTLKDLKGMKVYLPELTVSHYLLARGLESVGLRERDVKVVNTSDADLVAAFATQNVQAVVAWNPQLMELKAAPGAKEIFSSTQIPGEIIDMMVVNSQTLKDNPALGKALTGAWYEAMSLIAAGNEKALTHMAKNAGTDLAGYKAQLKVTKLFLTPKENLAFTTSATLPATMKKVAQFSFDKGLLGEGAKNAEAIGMTFPGKVTLGNQGNIKLRFDASFVQQAVDGKL
ncbi:lipid kinase [Betaproteobacteria bacterium]|nr:lipid kinase [Betaproteobacteria bacterium]GHU41495.1 lipid kinase [Betaproteobacteria bacterium]